MTDMIPYGRQDIDEEDIQSVINVLRSDFLTQGPVVPEFERAISEYCRAPYAVAVNSATSALHIACLALGIGKGDVVWTSPISFVASANCALYCGAKVDFVDIDPRTYNMSIDQLAEKLAEAEIAGHLPKAVIPVHLCGQPCDMAGIYALSQRYGFKIIEDASHAIGGKYQNEPIGNCRYSDITVFSFHPVKIITSGEGGMALTRNFDVARRMQLLRSHGITRESKEMPFDPDGAWSYQQITLGFNYRMTDIQAALGNSQLQRLDAFVAKRHELARRYDEMLKPLPVTTPWQHSDGYSAFHLYVIRLDRNKSTLSRRKVFDGMRASCIGVNVHYIPIHTQPYYRQLGFKLGDFPIAESYYEEAISLPLYSGMSNQQQDRVVATLTKAVGVI